MRGISYSMVDCRVKTRLFLILLLFGLMQQLSAEVLDPQNIVIENVHIVTEGPEQFTVNLLIRDNKLELVSKDHIPIPDGFVALDAQAGFLVGILTLGKSPSFMILDTDPRIDFEALLNNQSHSVFVVHNGGLRKNSLHYAKDMFEPQNELTGWHAYSPPPIALSTHYSSSDAWNHWTTTNTKNS